MTTTHPANSGPGFSSPDFQTTRPARSAFLRSFYGAESNGYNTAGDIRVSRTADGLDLNVLWAEIQAILSIHNEQLSKLTRLLSYQTTAIADPVLQSLDTHSFSEASEFGEPVGIRSGAEPLLVGYDFKDWDSAVRMTWQFLRDASAEQVRNLVVETMRADNKLTNFKILERLFSPAERLSKENHRVFGLWNGTDGLGPLPYLGRTFPTTTSHYLASGAPVVDSGDIEDLYKLLTHKGYGGDQQSQLLILANPAESEVVQGFKKGEVSRAPTAGETTGPIAKYDFIPSESAPAYLTDENIVGKVAPGEHGGLPVIGSYGPGWLIENSNIPAGWICVVASGGVNSSNNPVAFREHTLPEYRGLRAIAGAQQRMPLIETMFSRSFGTGVRHRSAAACLQVTTSSSYTAPVFPA